MDCPACGAPVPEGARFCPACGYELASRGEERRVATVLFADLVGFTALSESRDPEQVKRLVDRCFQKLSADVAAYGGVVDKIIGDAIVALFGAPVAHEDDAERAVRAALAMQRTLGAEAAELEAPIQMRIGVNTGEVVVGSVAGGDYTAMGDVVNTASRLQAAAPPGGVLVGPDTWAATRQAIRYADQGRLEARGRLVPVPVWLAEAAILPPGYRDRRDTPLVGRDDELGLLHHALNSAVARRRAHLIVLLGEAGVGKTRLAEEVATTAEATLGAVVLEGRCLPYGEANVWWPLAEAVRGAVGLAPDAPHEVARDVVGAAVRVALEGGTDSGPEGRPEGGPDSGPDSAGEVDRVRAGLLHLLGLEGPLAHIEPQRAREEAHRALLVYVEAVAARRPVVMILSDLHWADDAVLATVDALVDRLARAPFVLLATARQELTGRWTAGAGRHNHLVLNLDPLDRDAAAVLLDLLVEADLPREVEQELLDRAGGNPFFLEELVALVEESGASLSPMAGDEHQAARLPDTLRGLVAARLDALPPAERRLLDDAAVWGRRGRVEVLERMAERDQRTDVAAALQALVDKEILVVDEEGWRFRSDLLRDVAYGTLTKADRARSHYGIASYLDRNCPGPEEADEWLVDVVAHHYAHAAELGRDLGTTAEATPDLVDRALRWVEEAARRAKGSMMLPVSARLFTEALGLLADERTPRRLEVLLARAMVLADSRHLDAARADGDEAEALARELGDAGGLARVGLLRGIVAQHAGEYATSVQLLEEAAAALAVCGDAIHEADARRNIGLAQIYLDELAAAESSIVASHDLYRQVGDRRGEAWSLQQMAWISFMEERADEADERLGRAAGTFTELGDSGGLAWVRGLTAFVRFQQGDLAEARRLGDEGLEDARQRGDRWAEGMMLILGAGVRMWSGQVSAAVPMAEEALRRFGEIGDRFGVVQAEVLLGRALVMVGRVTEGQRLLEPPAVEVSNERLERFSRAVAAAVAVQVGDPRLAAAALGPVEATDLDPHQIGDVDRLVAIGLQRLQTGCVDESVELLSLAAEAVPAGVVRPYALASLALARAAAGDGAGARELADEVLELERSSYLDRAYATIAAALVGVRAGEVDVLADLDALVARADAGDDVVLAALAHLVRAEARVHLEVAGAALSHQRAGRRIADLALTGEGWHRMISLALGVAVPDAV